MAKKTAKKNVQDATLRNVRATKKRTDKLTVFAVEQLTELNAVKLKLSIVAAELMKLAARVDKLETPF